MDAEEYPLFLKPLVKDHPPQVIRLSRPEVVLVREFIKTGTLSHSATVSGISLDKAKKILARPEIKRYATDKLVEAAGAVGLTEEKVLSAINELVSDPEKEPSKGHLRGLDLAARVLNLIKPASVNVNQGIVAAEGFQKMSDEEFKNAYAARMTYDKDMAAQAEQAKKPEEPEPKK